MEMLVLLLYGVFMLAAWIYPMFSRKRIIKSYEGKLKSFPSVLHFFAMFCLPFLTISMVATFLMTVVSLLKGEAKLIAVPGTLIFACIGGALAYFYFRWRINKAKTIAPDRPVWRVLFDQFVLGLGTLDYFLLCSFFFFLMFFGIPLFKFDDV